MGRPGERAWPLSCLDHEGGCRHGRVRVPGSTVCEELTITDELDVRQFPPAKRHELIFESYEALQDGEGFVLINDHDPKPLYHQFEAEAGAEFRWEYQKKEQGEFRVQIGKSDIGESTGTATPDFEAPF
ncbi:DUF2249 domain-containing protein [Natronoarchaeum sp. GCM10025703]|uniref:DUF2249 domain-containing protein n=1 Tax=Natronoarchaeum sp. GCM10025703 TaxID=3252685 RepID=UPI003622AE95